MFSRLFGSKTADNKLIETKLPPTLTVNGEQLLRNGVGTRKKFGIQVYNVSLYLPQKTKDETTAVYMDGTKQVRLLAMRDLSGSQLATAFLTGIKKNAPKEKQADYFKELATLVQIFKDGKNSMVDDIFHVNLFPKAGAHFYLNNVLLGESPHIPGFNEAIIQIWLGKIPADEHCKQEMLAG